MINPEMGNSELCEINAHLSFIAAAVKVKLNLSYFINIIKIYILNYKY